MIKTREEETNKDAVAIIQADGLNRMVALEK